ncbi:MAG: AsmA-like C-terminal region-containing protein [Synergistaceae bacterium]|jgi:hypothetical protein|nr:AsmA-like C-terminal region-containing protein [Synergistaceae bacterium]
MKVLLRVCAGIALSFLLLLVGLAFGPIGVVLEPLVWSYGDTVVPSLRIGKVDGSLYSGLALNDVALVSGDRTLLAASRLGLRLSWEELAHGNPWLSELELHGVRADTEDLSALAARYAGGEEKSGPAIAVKPIHISIRDLELHAPRFSFSVEEGFLNQDGLLGISADLSGLPVRLGGSLSTSLEVFSLDASVGTGRVSLTGRLGPPFGIRGDLAVKIGELLAALPNLSETVEGRLASGELAGRFSAESKSAGSVSSLKDLSDLSAKGSFRLTGQLAGFTKNTKNTKNAKNGEKIPFSAAAPWSCEDGLFVSRIDVESLPAAVLALKISADLRPTPAADRVFVRGEGQNISLGRLSRVLPLGVNLEGDNGRVDFWVSADLAGKAAGKVFLRLPRLEADKKRIVDGLRLSVLLAPDGSVSVDGTGEVFGAKISASGGIEGVGMKGVPNLRNPAMTFTARSLDTALLAAAFPALATAGMGPAGIGDVTVRVTADEPGGASHFQRGSAPLGLMERLLATAEVRSQAVTLGGVRLDDLSASARYKGGTLTLENLTAQIGKAPLSFSGEFLLPASGAKNWNSAALRFDGGVKNLNPQTLGVLSAALGGQVQGLCDAEVSVRGTLASPEVEAALSGNIEGAPVSGKIEGVFKAAGPVDGMNFSLLVRSDALEASPGTKDEARDEVRMEVKNLVLDIAGTAQNVEVRTVKAEVEGGTLAGSGSLAFGRRGRFKVDMAAKGIDIRALLAQFGMDSGVVGGFLDGSLTLQGTPRRPEFVVRTTSPLTIRETLVDSLTATLTSPARGRFDMNVSARLGELTVALRGRMERGRAGWGYSAETDLLDVDRLVSAKMPSMKGRLGGQVRASLSGQIARAAGPGPEPVDVLLTLPVFEAAGARFSELSLPIRVLGDRVRARGSGKFCGGAVSIDADVAMSDRRWNAALGIAGLDIGQAAAPFLPQGEIVGSADVNVKLRGNYGALMTLFADGDFHAGGGYIHKIDAFELIAKGGRIDFEEVRGSFFWDGLDLRLNPGAQVTAKRGDPFYRYLSVNGPLGIPGKGLDLSFKGRFNINALNTVLGALRGAFQLMTGTLAGSGGGQILRSALGKLVGLPERDFQDVTFQIKGSWSELQLLNLKIDKSLENYLPLKETNVEQERKENEKKIQFNLRIPVGPGGSGDDENPADQMKRQFLDNLLNQVY